MVLNHFHRLAPVFVIALLWSACGSSETGTGTPGPVSRQDFAHRLAVMICGSEARCCVDHGLPHDATTCVGMLEPELAYAVNQSDSPKVYYDATAAGACIDAYANLLRSCSGSLDSLAPTCNQVLVGSVPEGGVCIIDAECARAGDQTVYCDAGVCTVESLVPAGGALDEPCLGTCTSDANGSDCACGSIATTASVYCETTDGLYCSLTTGTCQPLPTLGQPCDCVCADGSWCDAGTCVAQQQSGSCASNWRTCGYPSYCEPTSNQCVPMKDDGQQCSFNFECRTSVCSNTFLCGASTEIPVTESLCSGNI